MEYSHPYAIHSFFMYYSVVIFEKGLRAPGGSVFMTIEDRMKLIPYEAIVGLLSTIIATILYLIGF